MQSLHALEVFDDFSPVEDMDAATAHQLIDANRWYQLSNSQTLNKKRRDEAREKSNQLLDSILETQPEQPDAINLKGRIALDNGNISLARELVEQAIRLYPGKANYWTNRGFIALVQHQFEQAESFFTQALAYDKASIQAFSAIALCYYLKQDYIGAFLRYRSLLQKSVINQAGTHAMLDCCSHIKADSYDPDLESDLLKLYEIPELNHAQLSQVTSSILVHKYDLENEECILDVDTLASDELLISLLNKGELCDSRIEEVVTLLRQQILIEVAQTVSLRDELQELAIGLGRFIERTDFVPQASNDETIIVEDIDECIRGAFQSHVNTDDLAGALIVVSMYKQLYTQNYSYHLLNYDLTDWPAAIQPLLSANLYKKSDLHAIKFGLPHGNQNIDRSFNSPYLAAAYPRWEVLPYHTSANYYEALRSELGNEAVPEYWANKDINVLVIGCRTGDRAIRIARYFEGTKVTAIDLSADNIAYAIYQAKLHGVNNIDFHVINESKELQNIGEHFDVIEIADELSADLEVILHSKNMLAEDGLIRFEIAQDNHLINNAVTEKLREKSYLPTAENVRQLRSEIIQMEKENKEVSVSKNKDFYSLTGCYQLLFQTYDNSKATMRTVWDKTGLRALNNLSADHTVYTKVSGLTSHLRQA